MRITLKIKLRMRQALKRG